MADDAELVILDNDGVPVTVTLQPVAPTALNPIVIIAPQLAQTAAITDSTIAPPASYTPQIVVIANRRVNIRAKASLKSLLLWQVKKGPILLLMASLPISAGGRYSIANDWRGLWRSIHCQIKLRVVHQL